MRTAVAGDPAIDLAVLPEFLLGNPELPEPTNFSETAEHEYLKRFQALARELRINLVPGTLSQLHPTSADGLPRVNIAYWIDRTGAVLGSYVKKNLWHPERARYTKGPEPHSVFETEFGRTAFLICWDVMFAEPFLMLSDLNVDLIVVPSYWLGNDGAGQSHNPDSEREFLRHALPTRAFEAGAAVVYVNVGGDPDAGYIGLSQVALPLVGVKDDVVLGPTDPPRVIDLGDNWKEVLADAERIYKIRADRSDDAWHY